MRRQNNQKQYTVNENYEIKDKINKRDRRQ